MLQLQTRRQGRLGDLELLGRRLRGREPVLQLVPGLRECLGERVAGMLGHPGEDLDGDADRRDGARRPRRDSQMGGRARCDQVAGRRRSQQRSDQV
jgi:hypothetical protein